MQSHMAKAGEIWTKVIFLTLIHTFASPLRHNRLPVNLLLFAGADEEADKLSCCLLAFLYNFAGNWSEASEVGHQHGREQ